MEYFASHVIPVSLNLMQQHSDSSRNIIEGQTFAQNWNCPLCDLEEEMDLDYLKIYTSVIHLENTYDKYWSARGEMALLPIVRHQTTTTQATLFLTAFISF